MDISEIVASKLAEKQWSQTQLAWKSGITVTQVNRIVRGISTNVTIATLRALARAFNCSVVDLLPDEDKRAA